MTEEIPIFFQVLIWLNLYWYVFLLTFIPAMYYIFNRLIAFPLAPNKPHEFMIIAKPEKVKIQKVANRIFPFFTFKKGLYWFSSPCGDVENFQKYHVYIEGINQSVVDMERRESKLDDILQTDAKGKQIIGHQIRVPIKIKDHLHRHYALTLDKNKKLAILTKTSKRQPFKISLYHTLGIYIQEDEEVEQELEHESSTNGQTLIQLTNQTVVQQINFVQNYSYFSSSTSFNIWKKRRKLEMLFVSWLKGSADPRLMAALIIGGSILAVMALLIFGGVFE